MKGDLALVSGLWADSSEDGLIDLKNKALEINPILMIDIHHWDENSAHLRGYKNYYGHSFGNAAILKMIGYWPNDLIDHWGLIDPVEYWWKQSTNFFIPTTVSTAICFRRVRPWIPAPSSLILNPIPGVYDNIDGLDSSHKAMPRNPIVVDHFLSWIKTL